MTYNTIFARSFSKHDQRKLGCGAFVACLIIALSICTVFKPDLNPLPAMNLQVSFGAGLKNLLLSEEIKKPHQNEVQTGELKQNRNISEPKSIDTQTEELKQIHNISDMNSKGVQTEELKPIGRISQSSSTDLRQQKFKPIPIISEPISTDLQSEELNQIRNSSGPNSADVQAEEFKPLSNISEPKPTDVQTEEFMPTPITSEPISTDMQSKELIRIRNMPEPKSTDVHTEEFKPIPNISKPGPENVQTGQVMKPICNTSQPRTDVCEMSGDTRIDGKSSNVFLALPNTAILPEKSSWSIKPYARKEDRTAMGGVKEFTVKMVKSEQEMVPACTKNHSVVGIVFSTNGYCGNHFHDFTDTIVPLYLTSREFEGEVKFLVTNKNPWWIIKYRAILQKLSKYEVIDIDKENEVHCFPKMIVGLKQHKEFNIDPSRSEHSMIGFKKFLREAYSLRRERAIKLGTRKAKIPRLLIVSRKRTRSFLNQDEIINLGRNMGFEVINAEADSNEARFAKIVNSCDVMMGVHGAGLTNIVFLPKKAVFIQILGMGNMQWLARTYFGEPAKSMDLRYLEYQIGVNESSLIQQYPIDHPVFRDPHSIGKNGWLAYKEVYLDKQNVRLDVGRFRETLQEALQLLHV